MQSVLVSVRLCAEYRITFFSGGGCLFRPSKTLFSHSKKNPHMLQKVIRFCVAEE
jgi:hypothetical protein